MCLGIPGKIIAVYEAGGLPMGKVDFGGVTKECCLAYVPEATVGDYTIIHVGFALNVIDEAEALASHSVKELSGHLKVLVPPAFAVHQLAKHLPKFRARHPLVSLELTVPGPVASASTWPPSNAVIAGPAPV